MISRPNRSPLEKPASILDVARQAGVSAATVSRILHGGKSSVAFSEATRKKVQEAAQALQYVPSFHARSLRSRRAGRVAILSRYPDTPVTGEVMAVLADKFSAMKIQLSVEWVDANHDKTLAVIRNLAGGMADAIFFMWPGFEVALDLVSDAAGRCPVIGLFRKPFGKA